MKNCKIIAFAAALSLSASCTAERIELNDTPERGFYSTRPAAMWEESLVTGNGTMGAMIAGYPYHESIVLNHALLYMPLHEPHTPVSQGKHLDEIRRMMLADKFGEASQWVVDQSVKEGFDMGIHYTDPYIPAFQLSLSGDSLAVEDYVRTVDFTTGEVEVKWRDSNGIYSRQVFVSRPDSVVAIRLRAAEGGKINTTVELAQVTECEEWWIDKFNLGENYGFRKREVTNVEDGLCYRAWYEKTWEGSAQGYEGVVKVVDADGDVRAEGGKLIIGNATEVLMLARVEPSWDMEQSAVSDILDKLDRVPADYAKLLGPHRRIQSDLFNRVSLDLHATAEDRAKSSEDLLAAGGGNPALIERLFDAARYNIISCTGTNPPNLQGIWGATMTPPWSSDFTTNGNLPVAISHYLQANTPELMLPLFDKLESLMDDFRENARVLFNCRGICIPSHFNTHGLNNHFDATWPMTFWTVGAAWYSMFYYDYYLYTQDMDFLRNRALPFMEQAAQFYEDFLIEGADGKLMFCPSYSPENHPANYPSQACINATMEVMGVNGLLRAVIASSRMAGVNGDKIAKWESMLAKMPPYELNEQGEIREWLWKDMQDNHNHRHASHLFGLYDLHDPQIMESEALREGCKRAIDRRMEIRRRDKGGIMAFGMVHLAFAAAAMGESETAYDMLQWLGNSYWNNNLVSTHDPGYTFNLDISGGYPSLVMKMLVYAEPGVISLLPCLPKEWQEGSLKGVALRGGILMKELSWDAQGVQAVFLSQTDQVVKVEINGKPVGELALKAGESVAYRKAFNGF